MPVIGSADTGLSEVVEHGVTGSLHALGAVDEMAEAAIALLSDEPEWTRASRAARARAVENFAIDRVIPRYEQLYDDVLAEEES